MFNIEKKYGKEGQHTHITFGYQQVNSLIFPDIIRQPAATGKTKIEAFIKNIN